MNEIYGERVISVENKVKNNLNLDNKAFSEQKILKIMQSDLNLEESIRSMLPNSNIIQLNENIFPN